MKKLKEDGAVAVGGAPANVVGGGQVAGLGVGPQGEPGVNLKKKKRIMPFAIFARKTPK